MGKTCSTCQQQNINISQLQKNNAGNTDMHIENNIKQFTAQISKYVEQLRDRFKQQLKQAKIYHLDNKNLYIGCLDYSDSKNGYGEYYMNESQTFCIGQFKDDILNGEGIIIFQQSNYIKALFINGKPEGEGHEKIGRNYFHGIFSNGTKAKGVLTTDQYRYEGYFKSNKFCSYGTLEFQNGDIYEGDFVDGVYHGDGTYRSRQNGVYHGEWKNGLYDGKGRFNWQNGWSYEGQYKQGVRNGYGKMNKGGDIFEGTWQNGQLQGFQKLKNKPENPKINSLLVPTQQKMGQSHRATSTSASSELAGYTIQLF